MYFIELVTGLKRSEFIPVGKIDGIVPFRKHIEKGSSERGCYRWCEIYLLGGKKLVVGESYDQVVDKLKNPLGAN